MFSFRRDKTGFFSTLTLIGVTAAAGISTLVLWLVGLWDGFSWIFKIIWAAWWILCIVTVLVRLAIFRYQMVTAQRRTEGEAILPPPNEMGLNVPSPEGSAQMPGPRGTNSPNGDGALSRPTGAESHPEGQR